MRKMLMLTDREEISRGLVDGVTGREGVHADGLADLVGAGVVDPQLDLVYWGTGNAEPYDPRPREAMDSLYTSSVLAIRPKTGEIVWPLSSAMRIRASPGLTV